MLQLQGIPVSPGVAIGPALVLDSDGYRIERCTVPDNLVGAESCASGQRRQRRFAGSGPQPIGDRITGRAGDR